MPFSDVEIVNAGLTLLGEPRIASLTDDTKQGREAAAIYGLTRDALIAGYSWNFAKARVLLAADAENIPAFQWAYRYPLPPDCLRIIMIGDHYVGLDFTDYRGAPTEEYEIEANSILMNDLGAIQLKYCRQVTDSGQFSANFAMSLAAKVAENLAETLTQSPAKKTTAQQQFAQEIRLAIRANAIEIPPQKLPDDEWISARL